MDYSNLTGGLRVQSQIPLDAKQYSPNETTLKNLGISNNLAFTYQQGLVVYCILEKTRWEWREVMQGESNTGLLSNDFIYPDGIITFGINYSLKRFNFFPYVVNGTQGVKGDDGDKGDAGEKGEQGDRGLQGIRGERGIGINGINGLSSYAIALNEGFVGSEVDWLLSLVGQEGPQGPQGNPGIDASNNLQKEITGNYTLQDSDNNYTILVNNGVTNVKITYPGSLMENFCACFIQQGTGLVEIQNSGTGSIFTPTGFIIKGQNYNAYIEQIGLTSNAHLIGNLKI